MLSLATKYPWLRAWHFDVFFVLVLLVLAQAFEYFEVINTPPNGVHAWRQSDGASMAFMYYQEGNGLLQPEMHNRFAGEGKAVGEFPGMYYLVSWGYHIFGFHHWVFRLLWALCTLSGLFFLYKFADLVLRDKFWAMFAAAATFTSPILVFYGISYVPDPVALSFVFISWYLIYRYIQMPHWKLLLPAVFFVTLAGLLKVTTLVPILAFGVVYGIILLAKAIREKRLSKLLITFLLSFAFIGVVVVSWILYSKYYNAQHNSEYFMLGYAAIWNADAESLAEINEAIRNWFQDYYYKPGFYILCILAALTLIPAFNKHLTRSWYWMYLLSVAGMIFYLLLFYIQLRQHDYYIIGPLFIVPLTFMLFVKKFRFLFERRRWLNYTFRGLAVVLLALMIGHAERRADVRFSDTVGWMDPDMYELRHKLGEFGLTHEDLVFIPDDLSPNISLYALNLKGWTAVAGLLYPEEYERMRQGADYLIVFNPDFYDDPLIDPYRDNLIGEYKGIRIYSMSAPQ